MKLPEPPKDYTAQDQKSVREILTAEDRKNHKRNASVEVGKLATVNFTDTVTGTRYAMSVASGVVTLTAL